MRKIHLRLKDNRNFKVKSYEKGVFVVNNAAGNTMILKGAKLKRSLVFGYHFEDHWSKHEKWFTDMNLTSGKLWEVS